MKNRHLTIYVGDQEPRDKPAFLWIHRDPVTGYILFQINNGIDSWETITDSSMIAENMQHTLDILNDYIEDAQEAIEAAERLAQDMSTHAVPYIGDNGNWFTWNYQTNQYEDTGKQAKGDTGAQGSQGPQGETGPAGPQGPQGNTGSSVAYPYELVNNCTTDDATKGLAASQGVVLKGEVSQLAQKMGEYNWGSELKSCLALSPAQADALTRIPQMVMGIAVSNEYTFAGPLYLKYCGKRKNYSRIIVRIEDSNGDNIASYASSSDEADNGLIIVRTTDANHAFKFLIDLRVAFAMDNHTGSGNYYDYGTTLPISIDSIKNTNFCRLYNALTQISANTTAIADKVDKVAGKGLSTNDYTDADKDAVGRLLGSTTEASYTKSTGRLSEFIPAQAGKRYKITFESDNSTWADALFTAYDGSGSLEVKTTIASGNTGYLETPEGTTRILVYNGTSITGLGLTINADVTLEIDGVIDSIDDQLADLNTRVTTLEASDIKGKKIVVFGDSLSEFDTAGKGWIDYANDISGTFIKGAVGGSRLIARHEPVDNPTTNDEKKGNLDISNLIDSWINNHWTGVDVSVAELGHDTSIQNLKDNPIANVDMVVIMGGLNDIFQKGNLGTVTDTSKTVSTSGALYHSIASLLTAKPLLKIFVVIEPPFYYGSSLEHRVPEEWSDVQFSDYNTGIEYRNALAAICEKMRVPYCDLYFKCGWNQVNFPTIYGTTGNADNHHPRYGWKLIGEKVHSFILANL